MPDKPTYSVILGPWACPVCWFNRGDKRHSKRCAALMRERGKGKRFGAVEATPSRYLPDPIPYVREGGGYRRVK